MKKISLILFFSLLIVLFASCERPNYNDEIWDTYREADRQRTSGVIIDGNIWSARSLDSLEWEDAVSYCKNLTELGYSDWRLPTVNELRTLIQNCSYTETGGSCEITDECLAEEMENWDKYADQYSGYYLPDTIHCASQCNCRYSYDSISDVSFNKIDDKDDRLWSSMLSWDPEQAWLVSFYDASIFICDIESFAGVRCIRKNLQTVGE